jgi:hypothetical protein
MPKQTSDVIPTLTEVVPAGVADEDREAELENLIAELQTELAASTFALTERLLHTALSEMEATLFEQISNRLRRELPELVDGVLRRHLESGKDTD